MWFLLSSLFVGISGGLRDEPAGYLMEYVICTMDYGIIRPSGEITLHAAGPYDMSAMGAG